MRQIECVHEGSIWAIKHNGGYLGYAASEREAERVVDALRQDIVRPALSDRRKASARQRLTSINVAYTRPAEFEPPERQE